MEIKDIITLIHEVSESKLTSFTYEEGGVTLKIEAKRMPKPPKNIPMMPIPNAGFMPPFNIPMQQSTIQSENIIKDMSVNAEENTVLGEDNKEDNLKVITSPMVGTFYSAPKEGDAPFVSVGDTVRKGQTVGIVEAMKLMNEIESPYDGVVAEILVKNKDMIGFGQNLIKIK